jgi:limonene-1,2-epoxide hydrolase
MKKLSLLFAAIASLTVGTSAPAAAEDDGGGLCAAYTGTLKAQCKAVKQIVTNVNLANVAEQYTQYYGPNAQFNDPTITVEGRDNIIAHLQVALSQITIADVRVKDLVQTDGTWVALYEMDSQIVIPIDAEGNTMPIGEQVTLIAATAFKFNQNNKIKYHRDYYDQFALLAQIPDFDAKIDAIVGEWIGSILGGGAP